MSSVTTVPSQLVGGNCARQHCALATLMGADCAHQHTLFHVRVKIDSGIVSLSKFNAMYSKYF
jgi:hypothetical protein